MQQKHHICICICTFKRPKLLKRLLAKLEAQNTDDLFDYSTVIVDNDRAGSAKKTVESYAQRSKIIINYLVQPEQNIALTRNKAVENAKGDFLAFIDDDELPFEDWLLEFYKAIHKYQVDGILGPVLPDFEKTPPNWVLKGKFFDRPTHPTGQVLDWRDTRTGNARLKRDLFNKETQWFDPIFGSGGEDRDFFRRKIEAGHIFIWCNEAPVFENVPPERWKRKVMIKRALLRGKVAFGSPSANSS